MIDVGHELERIQAAADEDDSETAHILEDKLWLGVLSAIAARLGDAEYLATQAIKSQKIKFSRWHA